MSNPTSGGAATGASRRAHSDAILERLLELHPKKIDLSLERLHRLLTRLGHPERAMPPVIHVAGTNGKGSVCSYLRAGLEASGASVHVYSSPHLVRFHERIRLAGRLIAEERLAELLEECERVNGGAPITFFEITTAAAFLAFARTTADWCILEVGLGGRLDATNVIETPRLTAITSISRDHEQFLGSDVAGIAAEKAGIVKPGVPCVVGAQNDERALQAIELCASQISAPLLRSGVEWTSREEDGRLLFEHESGLMDLPTPRLPGRHQIENAGVAVAAMAELGLPEEAIAAGVARAEWPARLQKLTSGPLRRIGAEPAEIWVDGGHNAAAGEAIAAYMAELEEGEPAALYLICGMMAGKDAEEFLRPFVGLARRVLALRIPEQEGAMPAEEVASAAIRVGHVAQIVGSLETGVRQASSDLEFAFLERPPRILICGSLYLAGVVLRDAG